MNKTLIIISFVTFLLLGMGCTSKYSQVWRTKSCNVPERQDSPIYENDTLIITYNFWANHGRMLFSIYNKLNKPLFIDWNQSFYTINNIQLPYWQAYDSVYHTTNYKKYLTSDKGVITTEREHITFIPPHTSYKNGQFQIITQKFDFKKDSIAFDSITSIIRFRNCLVYATDKKFDKINRISNDFYVNKIHNKVTQLNAQSNSFYISRAVIKPINHILSASAIIETTINGGALGASYEYLMQNQKVGINLAAYYLEKSTSNINAYSYLFNANLKFYLGNPNSETLSFFYGPSLICGYDYSDHGDRNGVFYFNSKRSIGASAHIGIKTVFAKQIIWTLGTRIGLAYITTTKKYDSVHSIALTKISGLSGLYTAIGFGF